MALKVQVAKGLKWQAINIVGRQLLSLVVFTSLARLLEPSAFGLVALVGVYLGFVGMFVDQGIGTAIIQRQDLQPEHKDAAFWFNLGCATILCLGTMALAEPISVLFKEPQLAPLLRWSSIGMVIGASAAIHGTLFTREMDFRQPVIRALIANAVGGAVGLVMALAGCGVWSLVGQQLVGEVAGAVFLWTMSSYRPSLRFSLPHFRQLFGISSAVFVTSILWYFSTRLDQVIIGRFAGMTPLGLYTVAGKLPTQASTVTRWPLATVALPSLARLQNDHSRLCHVVYQGMELNATISFAVFVGLAIVAPDLVPFLFGAKWTGAAVLCSLLSLYWLVDALNVFFYPLLLASGQVGTWVMLNAFHVLGVLVACLVGIQFSVNCLVLGLLLNDLIMTIPGLLFVRRRIGLSPLAYCKPCLMPALASLLMVGAVWLLSTLLPASMEPIFRLACKVAVGAVVYLGWLWFLAPSTLKKLVEMISHALRRPKIMADAPLPT